MSSVCDQNLHPKSVIAAFQRFETISSISMYDFLFFQNVEDIFKLVVTQMESLNGVPEGEEKKCLIM